MYTREASSQAFKMYLHDVWCITRPRRRDTETLGILLLIILAHHFYFLIARGFSPSPTSGQMPWSQASSLLPPGTCHRFYIFISRIPGINGSFSISTAPRLASNFANSLALSACRVLSAIQDTYMTRNRITYPGWVLISERLCSTPTSVLRLPKFFFPVIISTVFLLPCCLSGVLLCARPARDEKASKHRNASSPGPVEVSRP